MAKGENYKIMILIYFFMGFIVWSILILTLSHFEIGPFKIELNKTKKDRLIDVGFFFDKFGNKYRIIQNEHYQYTYFNSREVLGGYKKEMNLESPWLIKEDFKNWISNLEINNSENERRIKIIDNIPFKNLYHITHKKNLKNILKYGLLSDNELKKKSIYFSNIANLDVKKRRGVTEPIYNESILNYVPLYFTPKNPMLYVKQDLNDELLIIVIHPYILFEKDLLFTDGNASSSKTKFFSNLDNLKFLDWECISSQYWTKYEDGKRKRCSEVLVPNWIDVNYFYKIVCNNEKLYNELSVNFSESTFRIELDKKYFF